MNFTSASDFQFVTGDLADIEIDNDIMPKRSGDAAKYIRGMDVAFLMEAVEERRRAAGLTSKSWTFSKSITKAQVNEIRTAIVALYASQMFLKSKPTNENGTISGPTAYSEAPTIDTKLNALAYSSTDVSLPTIGDTLLASDISAMFTALYNLTLVRQDADSVTYPYSVTRSQDFYRLWEDGVKTVDRQSSISSSAEYQIQAKMNDDIYYGTGNYKEEHLHSQYDSNNVISFNRSSYGKAFDVYVRAFHTTGTSSSSGVYGYVLQLQQNIAQANLTAATIYANLIAHEETNEYFTTGVYPITDSIDYGNYRIFNLRLQPSHGTECISLLCDLRDRTRWDTSS